MADRLTVHDRVQAIEHLGEIAEQLNLAAVWLVANDADAPGELAEQAARMLASALWILEGPVRPRAAEDLAAWALAAGNGYRAPGP